MGHKMTLNKLEQNRDIAHQMPAASKLAPMPFFVNIVTFHKKFFVKIEISVTFSIFELETSSFRF